MNQIKIDDEIYEYKSALYQLTLGTHATIYLTFDLLKFPNYKNSFFNLFDNRISFDISSSKIISKENKISAIDYDNKKNILNITIKTQLLIEIELSERRDQIIDDLLKII